MICLHRRFLPAPVVSLPLCANPEIEDANPGGSLIVDVQGLGPYVSCPLGDARVVAARHHDLIQLKVHAQSGVLESRPHAHAVEITGTP